MMRVSVHVRETTILVQCGDGTQKVRWLASVGFARYDHNNGLELGQPRLVRTEDGAEVSMEGIVREALQDDGHVWVLSKDDA